MITPRDQEILDMVERTGAVKTSHIQRAFMKDKKQARNIAERRLKKLCELNMIRRTRAFINTEYIYYQKKTLLDHKLALAEFYVSLQELPGKILKFETERQLGDVRPDAVCDYLSQNSVYQFFIEVHLATIPFNQQKYEDFYQSGKYRQWYKIFPRVLIVSDREVKLQQSKIKYIQISTSCHDIERMLK